MRVDVYGMRHAVYVPPFGPLADPHILVEIGTATEQHGWAGFFPCDHVLSPIDGNVDGLDFFRRARRPRPVE